MQKFVDSVKQSLENGNWYSALIVTLTLPDIAGKVDYPGEVPGRVRYRSWFNQYLLASFTIEVPSAHQPEGNEKMVMQEIEILSGDDCYALRCSYLHEGSDDINGQRAQEVLERFVFTEPNEKNNTFHRNLINGNTLALNVKLFSEEILVGIESWLVDIKNDATKQQALNEMTKLHQFMP